MCERESDRKEFANKISKLFRCSIVTAKVVLILKICHRECKLSIKWSWMKFCYWHARNSVGGLGYGTITK